MTAPRTLLPRVLADVEAHPGATCREVALRLGVPVRRVQAVVSPLRQREALAPLGTLVPVACVDMSDAGPRQRDIYAWACDCAGTPHDYAEAVGIPYNTAKDALPMMRRRGALAPSRGLWTPAQVEAAQDAAWATLDRVLRGAA